MVIGDAKSTPRPVNASVVQDSYLGPGPMLWLVYINQLLTDFRNSGQTFTAFADDIFLYLPIAFQADENKMQHSLRHLN